MQDLIYRQEAIDAMHQYSYFNDFDVSVIDEDIAVIALKDLQSAQPYTDEEIQKMQDIEQAQLYKAYEMGNADALRWIPCSERLPEEGERVLATHLGGINPNNQVIEHIYQHGKFTCGWDMDMNVDSPTFGQRYMGDVIAWMPLPEPYKEDDDGTR